MPFRIPKLFETTQIGRSVCQCWKILKDELLSQLCQSGFNQTLLPKEEDREIHENRIEKEDENLKDMATSLNIIPTYRNLMLARRILPFYRSMSAGLSRY